MNEDVRNWGHTSDLENGPSSRDFEESSYFEQEEPVLRCFHGFIVDFPAECPEHPDHNDRPTNPTPEEAEAIEQALRNHEEQYADMMEAHQQYESEMRGVPESERPTFEEWLEAPDPIDTDLCPEHKVQVPVEGFGSTGGADPYSVAFLECGHAIWSPGPGDIAIYATDSKRLAKWNEKFNG